MTAREELSALVGGFSEEEAQRWLERISADKRREQQLVGGTTSSALDLLRTWAAEPRGRCVDDWDELRSALEEDRLSDRPLFP